METITTIPTMQALWQLLQPSLVYNTRGRFEKCCQDWHSMDDAQKLRVFRIIE